AIARVAGRGNGRPRAAVFGTRRAALQSHKFGECPPSRGVLRARRDVRTRTRCVSASPPRPTARAASGGAILRIAIEPGSFDVDGRAAALLLGMSLKAGIIAGKRRIVDVLLAQLREHMHDTLCEW